MDLKALTIDSNVSDAVKEIVEQILKDSPKYQDSVLQIHIKSSARSVSSRGWFYVKVLTSLSIKKGLFSESHVPPALYAVLKCMQELEDESHLCVQTPGQGADPSAQYNLVLNGHTLDIQQEVARSKPCQFSTVYLRMHQNLLHVMHQCRGIHNYLVLLKVFRPQWDISFRMKLGEVQSKNDFRIDSWRRVSEMFPCIVTDTSFYMSRTEHTASESCPSVSFSLPSHIAVALQQDDDTLTCGEISVQLSATSLIIPIMKQAGPTYILTGPGFIPLEMDGSKLLQLFEHVSWSQFGLKKCFSQETLKEDVDFPCHSMIAVETYKNLVMGSCVVLVFLALQTPGDQCEGTDICRYDLDTTLEQHKAEFVQCIEGVLEKTFLLLQDKNKMRNIAVRSIASVCKAITDIVTLSEDEEFRSAILTCMQVKDTVDLGISLEAKLSSLGQDKHHGIWTGVKPNATTLHQYLPEAINQVRKELDNETGYEKRLRLSMPSNTNTEKYTIVASQVDGQSAASPFYQLTDSDPESSNETEDTVASGCVGDLVDRTPEIAQITEGLEQVSPFQELGEDGYIEHPHYTSLNEDPYKINQTCPNIGLFLTPLVSGVRNSPTVGQVSSIAKNHFLSSCSTIDRSETNQFQQVAGDIACTTGTSVYSTAAKETGAFETLTTEEWSADFNVGSNNNDKSTSYILRDGHYNHEVTEAESISMGSKACISDCKVVGNPDSDDWFDDVLEEVEDWLN